eukprot:COSAG05_NODE_7911_length_757_cov_1.022796_2_plen_91_part_01
MVPRVPIWNRVTRKKVTGNNAPMAKNLKSYLQRHQDCEPYVRQDQEGASDATSESDDSMDVAEPPPNAGAASASDFAYAPVDIRGNDLLVI